MIIIIGTFCFAIGFCALAKKCVEYYDGITTPKSENLSIKTIAILFAIAFATVLTGCEKYENLSTSKKNVFAIGYRILVCEFDSCEYVILSKGGITHKGNCKFCEERGKNKKDTIN